MASASSAPIGSLCAVHPERQAPLTCGRCGNFMCSECSISGTADTCANCRQLAGTPFPFSRTDFDFSRIWEMAFERWKAELWLLVVCGLIVFGAGMIGGFIGIFFNLIGTAVSVGLGKKNELVGVFITLGGQVVSQIISMVLQGIGLMGLIRVCIDVLEGKKADPARMFTQVGKAGQYVMQLLIISVAFVVPILIYLGMLMVISLVIGGGGFSSHAFKETFNHPGTGLAVFLVGLLPIFPVIIYCSLPIQFASMELVYGNCTAMEALRRSWALADGFRAQIFGYGLVGGLVLMAGLIVCCVGMLAAFPLQHLLMVSLYLSLRNGSNLPAPTPA